MAAITDGIWGGTSHSGGGGYTYNNEGTVFEETVSTDKEWHINNEFTNIEVDSAAVKTLVVPTSEDEMIRVCAQVPKGKSITVSAVWDGDSLRIAAHPKSVTFDFGLTNGDGLVGWLDDIFGDSNGIAITIEIPERILNSFTLKQGSGTTIVRNINAMNNSIGIGSGTVNFYGSGQYSQRMFSLDLGSGKACVTNMLAEAYNIDIGSGKFVVSGLKGGDGRIDFGSGKGSIFYSEFVKSDHSYNFGDNTVDMGSGSLDMYLPSEASSYINYDIGSGYVNIDALGVNQKLTNKDDDDDEFLLGSYSDSTGRLVIDMGSGNVNILDYNEETLNSLIADYKVDEPSVPPKSSETAVASSSSFPDSEFTTIISGVTVSSLPEEQSSDETSGVSSVDDVPTPPEVPDAPNPPEVPEVPNAPNPPEVELAA